MKIIINNKHSPRFCQTPNQQVENKPDYKAGYAYGSTTFRNQAQASGLEADECYCFGNWKEIPNLAIEVNLTSGKIDVLKFYQGLGITEVLIWYNKDLKLYGLTPEKYTEVKCSNFLPD